jgi:hypothetical protein
MNTVTGIETVGPRNIKFGSRLEAQWSYIFDALNFSWEYDPPNLKSYMPAFIINIGNVQVLIEVKNDNLIWQNHDKYIHKIINSGWQGYYIFLGNKYLKSFNNINIGIGGYISNGKVIKKTNILLYYNDQWNIDLINGKNIDSINQSYSMFSKVWADAKNKVQLKYKTTKRWYELCCIYNKGGYALIP